MEQGGPWAIRNKLKTKTKHNKKFFSDTNYNSTKAKDIWKTKLKLKSNTVGNQGTIKGWTACNANTSLSRQIEKKSTESKLSKHQIKS